MTHVVTPDYKGHTIALNDQNILVGTGPLIGERARYDSHREAVQKIDLRVAADEKQKRTKLALAALNAAGEPGTVTGIHATTSKLLGVGDINNIYPPDPKIGAILVKRANLSRQMALLDKALSKVTISVSRGYGRLEPVAYDAAVAKLLAEMEGKTALAAGMDKVP